MKRHATNKLSLQKSGVKNNCDFRSTAPAWNTYLLHLSLFNMGDFREWEILEMAELKKEIEESGVSNIK